MCGIAGIIGPNAEQQVDLIQKMTRMLIHRGPDDEGFYNEQGVSLGHRRLKVIDLETGHQPLSNEDGTIHIVFNGEIYNFTELRQKLLVKGHRFTTKSDTEVIAHLYEEDPDFINHLDGMFALGLWDKRKKTLILARDRVGKKPIYYSILGNKIYFASELKALLVCPQIPKDWDFEALNHFLSLNFIPGESTLFKFIRKLEAGHILRFFNGQCEKKLYWEIPTHHSQDLTDENQILSTLKDTLLQCVKKRLISDVPLGVFLSGGIDSSLVLSAMHELGVPSIKTFCIGFKETKFNESTQAKAIANHFKTDHHEFILEPNIPELLPKIIWQSDEPLADSSCYPTYLLSEIAKKEITVALSGDGGDEFFGGYNTYQADLFSYGYKKIPLAIRKHLILPITKLLPSFNPLSHRIKRFTKGDLFPPSKAHYFWNEWLLEEEKNFLFSPDLKKTLKESSSLNLFENLEKQSSFQNPIDLSMFMDQKTYLTDDILVKVDRMSMAHGLEVRSPLLDPMMILLSYRIPARFKVRLNQNKYILRKLLSSMIPNKFISKRKKGFSIPINQWFRNELKDLLMDSLNSTEFKNLGFFDSIQLNKLATEHFDRKANHGKILWTLMVLSIWYRQYKTF